MQFWRLINLKCIEQAGKQKIQERVDVTVLNQNSEGWKQVSVFPC